MTTGEWLDDFLTALLRANGIAFSIRPGFPAIPGFVARHAELGPAISLIDSSLVPHTWIGVGKQQAHVRQPRAHKFTHQGEAARFGASRRLVPEIHSGEFERPVLIQAASCRPTEQHRAHPRAAL